MAAAALYAINIPLSKLLQELAEFPPTMLAGFLYLGAGTGIGMLLLIRRSPRVPRNRRLLGMRDLPYVVAMVALDIAAPIFLMLGIASTSAANASLLNNFEIAATSIIALLIFRERVSKKLWLAIILAIAASAILTLEPAEAFVFNKGSVFVLLASLCWGFENNCTRSISDKSSEQIVLIKGIFSGLGSIIVALIMGEKFPNAVYISAAMLLGFVAYGLSINFYIMAQKNLAAAKTSAFYSVAPFLGVAFSFLILGERPAPSFYIALAVMIISTVITVIDTLGTDA